MTKPKAIERVSSQRKNSDDQLESVVDIRLPVESGDTWTIWGLFDCHVDDRACYTRMLKDDIARIAADPKARVIIGGDFNNMIFAGDPRYTASGLKPFLYGRNDKADAVVEYNYALLEPIANQIDLYISGNHEEGYTKRHFTDVAKLTAKALGVPYHSYFAVMRYFCTDSTNSTTKSRGWVHHGFGGSAPVTKGMIALARAMEQNRFDWDMLGHLHQRTFSEVDTFDDSGGFGLGRIRQVRVAAAQNGTYARNYAGGGAASWSAQKGHRPSALGAGRMYLDMRRESSGLVVTPRIN